MRWMVENTPAHHGSQQIKGHNGDKTLQEEEKTSTNEQRNERLTEFAEKVKKGRKIIDSFASGYWVQIAPIKAMIEPD